MKRFICFLLAAAMFFSLAACKAVDPYEAEIGDVLDSPEAVISKNDEAECTLKFTSKGDGMEFTGTLAYKVTDDGILYYEVDSQGTEYICEVTGDECHSYMRKSGEAEFVYNEVEYTDWYESDAEYYEYSVAAFGFDYSDVFSGLEFVKCESEKLGDFDCFVYEAEIDGEATTLYVDKTTGIWIGYIDSYGEYIVESVEMNADIIPEY